MNSLRIFFLCIVSGLSISYDSIASNFYFKNFSVSEGLVNKSVICFCQDSEGFLWVATTNGLCRFDGYEFKNYTRYDETQSRLQGTSVLAIEEGLDGLLWLSTSAGLESYDKKTEQFRLVISDDLGGYNYTGKMSVDADGNVWIPHTSATFLVFSPQRNMLLTPSVILPVNDTNFVIHNFIVHNSALWIATDKGILHFNCKTSEAKWIDRTDHSFCRTIHVIDSTKLVLTYMESGICTINTKTLEAKWIKKSFIEKNIGISTSLFDATVDSKGTYYISVSSGLVIVSDSSVSYYNSYSDKYYFEGNSFSSLYADRDGNIWVGTFDDGIFLVKNKADYYTFATELYKDDVKRTRIASLHVLYDNTLLYDDTKSLYRCSNYADLFAGCAQKIAEASLVLSFPLNARYSLVNIADTSYLYDAESKDMISLFVSPAPACASIDSFGIIWVGSWFGKLYGYNTVNGNMYEMAFEQHGSAPTNVFSIANGFDGSVWVGTLGQGLVHIMNPTAESPMLKYYNDKGVGSCYLNAEMVLSLHVDMNKNVWIGTNGNGLVRLDAQSRQFEYVTKKYGLKSNVVESVISDNEGNIWFATNVVSKYDVKEKTVTPFLQPDDVKGSFIVKACARSKNDDLLFASSQGIYVFTPSLVRDKNVVPMPVLTNLKIEGLSVAVGDSIRGYVPYKKYISFLDTILLPYALNSFSLSFASVDFHNCTMFTYECMLEGVDRTWVAVSSSNRVAGYAGLQPGKYLFKVRASLDSENWSPPRILQITIIPPWWKTFWFKILLLAVLIIAIVAVFMFRIRTMKRLNNMLEVKVKERTDRLTDSNNLLKEKQVVLEMKNEQIEEALDVKDRLIRVIAHDFKNPLSAIRGNLSLIKNAFFQFDADKNISMLRSLDSAAANLELQMSTVLDWALSEKQEISYNPKEISIEALIDDAIELVRKIAERKKISITTQFDYETNSFIDPRMISSVLRNLLVNAIKFTPENGTVAIIVQEYENDLEVSIIDSGIGMSQHVIEAIMNTDEAISTLDTDNEKSTGIGLHLSKLFVEKNKGKISVRSRSNKGSVVSFTIPKGTAKAIKQIYLPRMSQSDGSVSSIAIAECKDITILIIDDNESVLHLLHALFDTYYTVITASDGLSGLQIASNAVPSLIVSDISMPCMSGTNLCQALKEDEITCKIPIVLITANVHLMSEGYAAGADDFVVKPFDENELLMKVHSLLENRKRLVAKIHSEKNSTTFILPESYDDIVVRNVLEYVNEQFCNSELDAISIGNAVGLGRTQLWRKFKSATGQNLSEYIKLLRLAKAQEMLKTGKFKVVEVCYEVGFTNPAYFTKCFSKHFGYTPKEVHGLEL